MRPGHDLGGGQDELLRVAVLTRDKVETIRGIITFPFVLWLIGVVALFVAAGTSDSSGL